MTRRQAGDGGQTHVLPEEEVGGAGAGGHDGVAVIKVHPCIAKQVLIWSH